MLPGKLRAYIVDRREILIKVIRKAKLGITSETWIINIIDDEFNSILGEFDQMERDIYETFNKGEK